MKNIDSCDLCGGKDFRFLFNGKDRLHGVEGTYTLNQCKKCGLIFINPQPVGEELAKHYPTDYYTFSAKTSRMIDFLYRLYYLDGNPVSKFLLAPCKPLVRTIEVVKGGKCLDVGCGSGEFLRYIKWLGMDGYGVEPGEFDEKFVKENKLNVIQATVSEANFPDNFFDVITMNHVFEHVDNPTQTLEELYRILKPNGKLIIGVPQYKNPVYSLAGEHWAHLNTPRHLFIYSPGNLKQYAQKTGFKVEKVRYNMVPTSFFGFSFNQNKIIRKMLFFVFLPIANIFNLFKVGDQVEVVMVK